MKHIVRYRILILLSWILLAVGLSLSAPNMEQLVREKGQINVPDGYPSSIGSDILKEHSPKEKDSESIVVVFHNEKGISSNDMKEIEKTFKQLEKNENTLGINEITNHFNNADLKKQLVSKDDKTVLALLDVSFNGKEVSEVRERLSKVLQIDGVETYMTGNSLISEDVILSSQNGLKKTEIITLVFILVVLVLVFRSVVAPIIPLVAVGITYITSQSIVGYLVEYLNFPLSNFTQIFLVAVLFGIGTDYCILLLSRFKEELSNEDDVTTAILKTYKTAGKTVLFSGLAVLVGFASIGFATFKLYQSAAAVAVGIAVLLIALITIVPFFMVVLGKKMFWPIKGDISHSQSRIWGLAGSLSLSRPFVTLLVVAVIIVPLLFKYDGGLSFNSLDEIGEKYDSVKGFNIVSESFGPGESLPAKIVLKNDESMKISEYINIIEKISRELARVEGVYKVRSASRPIGDEVEDLYVNKQAKQLKKGLSTGNKGINTIKNGLTEAATSLKDSEPVMTDAVSGVEELVNGTNQLKNGIGDLKTGLVQIENGLKEGTIGLGELKAGLAEAKSNGMKLSEGMSELSNGYSQIATGLKELSSNYKNIETGLVGIEQSLNSLQSPLEELKNDYPGIEGNGNYQIISGTITGVNESLLQLTGGLNQLNQNLSLISGQVSSSTGSVEQLANGQSQLTSAFDQFIEGVDQLEKGIDAAAEGQGQIISQIPSVENGLGEISNGQLQLKDGFSGLVSQLGELESGLSDSATGLNQIGEGLSTATDYLGNLAKVEDNDLSGFFIPDEVLTSNDFQKVFDVYMSAEGKVTTFDVVLAENPYSNEAIDKIEELNAAVNRSVKGTKLENAQVGITGITSINHDLETISDADYSRTVVFMLVGIGLVLIVLLRSLIMPIYLVASLIITYYTSMSITEVIFVNILGYPGINWAVPFFGFVMLMALGVDYSIFLMDRFNEYKDMKVEHAMLLAMKNMGTVIISAVIILSGTFAAMLPSGVLSLLQIATVVLSGLLLYAIIILPFFVPVMVKIFGKANWWPFYINKS